MLPGIKDPNNVNLVFSFSICNFAMVNDEFSMVMLQG
jgi:hypothetical protein